MNKKSKTKTEANFNQNQFEKEILEKDTNKNLIIEEYRESLERNGVFYLSNSDLHFEDRLKQKIKEYNEETIKNKLKRPKIKETIDLDYGYLEKTFENISYDKNQELKSLYLICLAFKNQKTNKKCVQIRRNKIYSLLPKENINSKNFLIFDNSKVEIAEIANLSQFVKKLSELIKTYKNLYFRGQANLNWKVQPGIARNSPEREKDYIYEILRRYPAEFEKEPTYCEKLARMQHFGIPSRLLDITENPYIALFFACESNFEDYGEVRIYTADKQDIKSYNDRDIHRTIKNILIGKNSKIKNCILLGKYSNHRIQNQKGLFIFCSDISENSSVDDMKYKDDDLEYKDEENKRTVFVICDKDKKKILDELEILGITEEFVYPDIEDSAAYLKNKFLREKI